MRKRTYFDPLPREGWPDPNELKPYFLATPSQEWSHAGRNDSWGLSAEGLYGTEHLERRAGRVDVDLYMVVNPQNGVILGYNKWDGGEQRKYEYSSRGDLARLHEQVHTLHGSRMPAGLFIPFAQAWNAVKEFIETDGELPKSIEWIDVADLPPDAFSV